MPKNPEEVMVIRDVVPGITTFSVPFLRFGRIKIGGRGTVGMPLTLSPNSFEALVCSFLRICQNTNRHAVKLTSGSLAVFSPVALTPTVQSKLQSIGGPVSYLVAPDIEHHIFLSPWSEAFPKAQIIGPEGLAEKREKDPSVTNVPFTTIFTKANKESIRVSQEFDADFEYEFVDSHPNKELVFFHKPSKTLIEADLMFNLPATEQYSKTGINPTTGIATRLFGALQHTKDTAIAQKRVLWYGVSKSDREGFNKSMQKINSWGFENLIPCHGESIVGDGKGIFEKVFEWHLHGKK